MDKKSRYCPSCGDKTNDFTCNICGKRTKPTSMRSHEKELDLITDDIADQQDNFSGDKGHAESKQYHAQSKHLHMEKGEHPYFKTEIQKNSASSPYAKAIGIMVIVFFVIVFFFVMLGFFTHTSSSDQESYDNLEDVVDFWQ